MMSEESKPQKAKIEELELNKETVTDLTEQEGAQVRGGAVPQTPNNRPCTWVDTGCI